MNGLSEFLIVFAGGVLTGVLLHEYMNCKTRIRLKKRFNKEGYLFPSNSGSATRLLK